VLARDAYRVLGYRQCGERAVRVDILERLADLIRPALAWRETSPGEKPAGAFDGRGFVVTQAMTSLTGSAGEDFASILRALGYRMDRRPPPPPKPGSGCGAGTGRRAARSGCGAELIEVWRPGGRSDERRPRHDRNRHRHQRASREGAAPAAAAGEGGEPAKHERHRRGRRDRNPEFQKPGTDAPAEAATRRRRWRAGSRSARGQGPSAARAFPGQGQRPGQGRRQEGQVRRGRGRDKGGRDKGGRDKRPDSGPSHRQYATSARAARTRTPDRSQFAVCQTGGAQGAAHRQPQGWLKRFQAEERYASE
jgi:hypothetical protein